MIGYLIYIYVLSLTMKGGRELPPSSLLVFIDFRTQLWLQFLVFDKVAVLRASFSLFIYIIEQWWTSTHFNMRPWLVSCPFISQNRIIGINHNQLQKKKSQSTGFKNQKRRSCNHVSPWIHWFFLLSHIFQLFLADPEVFPGEEKCLTPQVCGSSTKGEVRMGGSRKHLNWLVSVWRNGTSTQVKKSLKQGLKYPEIHE